MSVAVVTADGWITWDRERARVALGEAGVGQHKTEGDRATPAGLLPIRRVLYRADRLPGPPRAAVPREALDRSDGWCDDPGSDAYNMRIRLPHPSRHEALWRDDGLYDVIGVLGWNDAPVTRHRGSAIFLHVAEAGGAPTAGCVAMGLPDLLAMLAAGVAALDIRSG